MKFSKMPVGNHADQYGKEISDVCDVREQSIHRTPKDSDMKLISIVGIGLAGVLALAAYGQTGQAAKGGHAQQDVVDASGNLRVPADYRTRYQFLGTWAIAADAGQGAKEMHNVYASPGAIAAYEDSG